MSDGLFFGLLAACIKQMVLAHPELREKLFADAEAIRQQHFMPGAAAFVGMKQFLNDLKRETPPT